MRAEVDTAHILENKLHWVETGFLNVSLPLIRPFADTINGQNPVCGASASLALPSLPC